MRFRSTLILFLVAVSVGAYVYFVEFERAAEEAKKKTLFEFKADDAVGIVLSYTDRVIELKKVDDAWRIQRPLDVAADDTSVRNLLNAIAECEVKREIENPDSDLSVYALDAPLVTVKVRLRERELPAVSVGRNTPVGFSTYISREDDKKVLLTSSAFRSGMDKQVKDLRDKTILSFEDDQVQRISIVGGDKNILLAHQDEKWTIERPLARAADSSTLRAFLSTLRSMRAIDFPSDDAQDLAPFGLDSPRLAVTLHIAKGDEQKTLLVGSENEKKEIFVKTAARPTVYTVSEWVFRDLNKDVKDFRDKTVLAFDVDAARRVEIRRSDDTLVKLTRADDPKWTMDVGEGEKPAEMTISQYVKDLRDLKGFDIAADQPASLAEYGLDPPLLAISVRGVEDAALGAVRIGRRQPEPGKAEYTASVEGGDTVFLIRDYLFTRLDKHRKDFLKQPTPTASSESTDGQDDVDEGDDFDFGAEEDDLPTEDFGAEE
jgi:hypothetical protein